MSRRASDVTQFTLTFPMELDDDGNHLFELERVVLLAVVDLYICLADFENLERC